MEDDLSPRRGVSPGRLIAWCCGNVALLGFAGAYLMMGGSFRLGTLAETPALTPTQSETVLVSAPAPSTTLPPTTSTTELRLFQPLREFTVASSGDVLIHSAVRKQASTGAGTYDFSRIFGQVESILSEADLAICHLEVPISADNRGLSGYPRFNAPTELASGLADAGFDACSTASNHSLDQGRKGVVDTLDMLDAAGVSHAGTARSEEESVRTTIHDVAGVWVGHQSYSFSFNDIPFPDGDTYLANGIDVERILADAKQLRAEGAEVVLTSLHWGDEDTSEPNDFQEEVAAALLASPDIDALIGHHSHRVQPIELIDGKPVVYGLGNFISSQNERCCGIASEDGVIVRLTFTETERGVFKLGAIDAAPTRVVQGNYVVLPIVRGDEDDWSDRSRNSADRTLTILESRLDDAVTIGWMERDGSLSETSP